MQMIGCDLHARQQTLAVLDTSSGVLEERVLEHTELPAETKNGSGAAPGAWL